MSAVARVRRPPERARAGLGGSPRVRAVLARVRRRRASHVRRRASPSSARRRSSRLGAAADAVRRRKHPVGSRHVPGRPEHQLHERLHLPLRVLRVLPAGGRRGGLRPRRSRRSARRSRRRSRSAARASSCRAASTPSCRSRSTRSCSRFLRASYPRVHRHAFSAPEIYFLAKKEKTIDRRRPRSACRRPGCSRVPGGGAEILEDDVRKRIWALTKAPTDKWAEVHREAHRLGMPTTATMMFGVGETARAAPPPLRRRAARAGRVARRRRRERSRPSSRGRSRRRTRPSTARSRRREAPTTSARSRSRASISTTSRTCRARGSRRARRSAASRSSFGADDLGSIMIEENVVAAAGSHNRMARGGDASR